jgi:Domain of unknown function (DUF3883)
MASPQLWVYKCNARGEEYQSATGDWAKFFRRPGDGRWGGEWSTKNPESLKIIRERMRPKDLVLCYQTDQREMVGVCELVRFVHISRGFRRGRNIILKPLERFPAPVKIHALKNVIPGLKRVRALKPGLKTLYDVNNQEAPVLLYACGLRPTIPITTSAEAEPKSGPGGAGGGFGSAAENREVETCAIKHVRRWYKQHGWKVESRERENIGYDLECSKSGEKIHIEVKGTRGSGEGFPITAQEYHCMKTDPLFVLAVVGNAKSSRQSFKQWNGLDALKTFDFRRIVSISYVARLKNKSRG